jgi:transaldolase
MKIFIESADMGDIRKAAQLGLLDGCTTNPSPLEGAVRKMEDADGKARQA